MFTFTGNTISWVYTSTDYNIANIAFKGKYLSLIHISSSFGDFLNRGGLDVVKQALFDSNRNFASEAGVW